MENCAPFVCEDTQLAPPVASAFHPAWPLTDRAMPIVSWACTAKDMPPPTVMSNPLVNWDVSVTVISAEAVEPLSAATCTLGPASKALPLLCTFAIWLV